MAYRAKEVREWTNGDVKEWLEAMLPAHKSLKYFTRTPGLILEQLSKEDLLMQSKDAEFTNIVFHALATMRNGGTVLTTADPAPNHVPVTSTRNGFTWVDGESSGTYGHWLLEGSTNENDLIFLHELNGNASSWQKILANLFPGWRIVLPQAPKILSLLYKCHQNLWYDYHPVRGDQVPLDLPAKKLEARVVSGFTHPELYSPVLEDVEKCKTKLMKLCKKYRSDTSRTYMAGWSQGATAVLVTAVDKRCPCVGGVLALNGTFHRDSVTAALDHYNETVRPNQHPIEIHTGGLDDLYLNNLLDQCVEALGPKGAQFKINIHRHPTCGHNDLPEERILAAQRLKWVGHGGAATKTIGSTTTPKKSPQKGLTKSPKQTGWAQAGRIEKRTRGAGVTNRTGTTKPSPAR
jgi:predicted esterase